jgi:hypothetical protein
MVRVSVLSDALNNIYNAEQGALCFVCEAKSTEIAFLQPASAKC